MDSPISLFLLNPDVELRIFGFAYFIFAGFTFPLFFIVIKTVAIKDRESPNMTYKLMNIINFTQLAQAAAHFLTSPALIFPNIMVRYGYVINVIGCVFNTCWIADFPMITLLAFSRILIFTNKIGTEKFPFPIKLYIFISWTWFAFVWVYGSITQNIIFSSPGWDYDFNVPYARLFSDLEIVVSIGSLILSYLAYIFMAFIIFKRKGPKNSVSTRKNEVAILVQSTLVTTYITAMIFAWHQALFSMFTFVDMTTDTAQGFVDCAFILHCYVTPATLLLCNKSIRHSCLKMLGLRKKSIVALRAPNNIPKRVSSNPTVTNGTVVMN